jgi:tRNA A-37 threonylcarbamoyl transferase component Bud32
MLVAVTDISADQRSRLDEWLGQWEVLADHSWPLQDTTVLHVRSASGDHIVKVRDQVGQEIDACLRAQALLADRAPRLEHHDAQAGILVTSYLPGELVEGTRAESDPDVYRQAGELLARLQAPAGVSDTYAEKALARVTRRIAEAEGLVPEPQLAALREQAGRFAPRPVRLHFTHGDYQPRNWVIEDGRVAVIDFERGQDRPWVSDLVRLQNQQFTMHPERERAFMAGLGRPVQGEAAELLAIESLRQSLGTVVWAHETGNWAFEEHGRAMITRFLQQSALEQAHEPPLSGRKGCDHGGLRRVDGVYRSSASAAAASGRRRSTACGHVAVSLGRGRDRAGPRPHAYSMGHGAERGRRSRRLLRVLRAAGERNHDGICRRAGVPGARTGD